MEPSGSAGGTRRVRRRRPFGRTRCSAGVAAGLGRSPGRRRHCQGHDELVDLYSRALFGPGAPWRLVEWRQTMRLDPNGDTRTRIEVQAVSEHVA